MEVLAAVAASVPAVLLLADKAAKHLARLENSAAKESLEKLKEMLSMFQNYLSDNIKGQAQHELAKYFANKIRDLTFEIEDSLDQFMFDVPLHFHSNIITANVHEAAHYMNNKFAISRLSSQSEGIQKKTQTLRDMCNYFPGVASNATPVHMTGDFLTHRSFDWDEMVGFKKRRMDLLKQLMEGDKTRATIQVVGPGGSGKTFLVNNVYHDEEIGGFFTCKAWIDMPMELRLVADRMLEKFCPSGVVGQNPDHQPGNSEEKLHRYLGDRRYLIVLDNVWTKQEYAVVADLLPRGRRGSRIIITTRNSNIGERPNHTHKLDGLTETEARELFYRKAIPDGTCPQDLEKLSKLIIDRCDRLPLAIAVVGNLLSKKRAIKAEWKKFCKSMGHEIQSNDCDLFNRFLKPSFVDLPDDVKSCFFYFSMFPEGHSIQRGRLVRSWIGEGFLEEVNGKTSEEVAETYLNDLIRQSLVRVSTKGTDGRVKSYNTLRLHHEFIVQLYGNEEKFVTVIDKRKRSSSVEKVRRLSVHHDNIPEKLSEISDLSHVRTFFAFGHKDAFSKSRSDTARRLRRRIPGTAEKQMENMFHKFRLLKVLDLQGMPLNLFPKDISSFVLLRCLNMRHTNIKTVPSSIEKLTFLEILDLKYTLVTELPKHIYKLQKLSHILVSSRDPQEYGSSGEAQGVKISDGIKALSKSLQNVSLINVRNHKEFIQELGNLEQLRKLGLADLKSKFGADVLSSIQKLKNLERVDVRANKEDEYLELEADMKNPHENIQRLYLNGRLRSLPTWISSKSLPSLVKVVLKGSKLNAKNDELEKLGALRSLMELEMVEYYTGEELIFKEGMFRKLKKLHVEKFEELDEVKLEKGGLAMLEKLTICHCKKLKPLLPSYRLGDLQELLVYDMSEEFLSDIQRRIHGGELFGHVQTSGISSSSGRGTGKILSRRYFS